MKERKAFPLRLEPKLYQELEAWAQQEMRSVNGQIEYLLRQAILRHRGTMPHQPDGPSSTDSSGQTA